MRSLRRKSRKGQSGSGLHHHRRSVLMISGVIVILSLVIFIHGSTLQARNKEYKAQETELLAQIEDEKQRSEEIEELKKYVGTDEHIESVAKDKLGLVHENEILFKSEH